MTGTVTLVGAGPGDPELLTLKAVRAIGRATVLLVDDLVGDEVLAFAAPNARIVHVGKRGGCASTPQAFIDKLMAAEALNGEAVVRLKGGDPFVFGRGGEEAERLRAQGIAVEVVNGITAGLAAVTQLGVPLTHREHAHGVIFVTAHARADTPAPRGPSRADTPAPRSPSRADTPAPRGPSRADTPAPRGPSRADTPAPHGPSRADTPAPHGPSRADGAPLDWQTLAAAAAQGLTLVVYMGVTSIEAVQAGLLHGLATGTPAAVVQHASLPQQRQLICTLGTLANSVRAEQIGSPAIVIVGDVLRGVQSLSPAHAAEHAA